MKFKKIIKVVIIKMNYMGLFKWMTDKFFLKFIYRVQMGKKLNLDNPQTFNEKIQWLKLNDKIENSELLVDKYEVRKYISENIGKEYLVPLIKKYNSVSEIDFNELPNKFVLKCTHDSGGVIICKNKDQLNKRQVIRKLKKSLNRNYYVYGREYAYKKIQPKIICEEYLDVGENEQPDDYKVLCFNGKPENIMVCRNRKNSHADYYFFDFEWKFLPYNKVDVNLPENFTLKMPSKIHEMYDIAKKLSKGFKLVRIDFYEVKGKLYFGEITLFPSSGFDLDITEETDEMFGNKIKL